MKVGAAKRLARQWVVENAVDFPGFRGAFVHGSVNWLDDEQVLSPTSDLDVAVVLDKPGARRRGKLLYRDLILDVSQLPIHEIQSAELILANHNLAGSFQRPSAIVDPSGELTRLQRAVAEDYATRKWVLRRCAGASDKVLSYLGRLTEGLAFHDQVGYWLFAAGITTHVLLVARLRNPTVRRRYSDVRELLAHHDRMDLYETLLRHLGCGQIDRERTEYHLARLEDAFDTAKTVIKSDFPFAGDISDIGRPITIEGSGDMISRGEHREAVFCIVATASRCQAVFHRDGPPSMRERFTLGYRELLADLGIGSYEDLRSRGRQIAGFLPALWEEAETIVAATPAVVD
jgi:hypothetical protein